MHDSETILMEHFVFYHFPFRIKKKQRNSQTINEIVTIMIFYQHHFDRNYGTVLYDLCRAYTRTDADRLF